MRSLRSVVAAWFSLPPASLAAIDGATIERMAMRLEDRREVGHPWAG